jgi:hypothetical protein
MSRRASTFAAILGVSVALAAGCVEMHGAFDAEGYSGGEGARVAVRGKPVVIPEGRIHYGDVVVVEGAADVQGEVQGSVVVIAGDLKVGPKAHITEDLVGVGNRTSAVASEGSGCLCTGRGCSGSWTPPSLPWSIRCW